MPSLFITAGLRSEGPASAFGAGMDGEAPRRARAPARDVDTSPSLDSIGSVPTAEVSSHQGHWRPFVGMGIGAIAGSR